MFSGSWKESEMESITIDIIDENITEECKCHKIYFNPVQYYIPLVHFSAYSLLSGHKAP